MRRDLRHLASRTASTAAAALLSALLAACSTTVHLAPTLTGASGTDCRVLGHVTYSGNPEYLPAVLVEAADRPADAVLRYDHEEHYGGSAVPAGVQVVNPLHLAGFPTGENTLSVIGRLDVLRAGAPVRTYIAVAAMKRSQSMFSEGETLTDMRRRGLLLVRDNIAAQVCADHAATQAILDAP